jgi:hypothetical protein
MFNCVMQTWLQIYKSPIGLQLEWCAAWAAFRQFMKQRIGTQPESFHPFKGLQLESALSLVHQYMPLIKHLIRSYSLICGSTDTRP